MKRISARLPDEECLPSNKNMKLEELHKQAYEDVLSAFNAESPTLSSVNPLFKNLLPMILLVLVGKVVFMSCLLSVKGFNCARPA